MTQQQAQKEYIITEEQLKVLEFCYISDIFDGKTTVHNRSEFTQRIRSRPLVAHTSSTEAPICDRCKTDQEPFCIGCERLIPHDTAIRNATLDDICNNCGGLADGGEQCKSCYVESLRKQGGTMTRYQKIYRR